MPALQADEPTFEVLLNGALVDFLQPLQVSVSTGGAKLDYATLKVMKFPVRPASSNLQNLRLVSSFNQGELQITLVAASGRRQIIHWGFIDVGNFDLMADENQTVTSRLQPYHFGTPINGQRVWSPIAAAARDSLVPIAFNCELDGRIAHTRSSLVDAATSGPLFLPPECQRTPRAMLTNGAAAVALPWTLPWAVRYLCLAGNAGEPYIRNPSFADLEAVLSGDPDLLRNHRQPFGEYLPENLDQLLTPYGYVWFVDVEDPAGRKICVQRRGSGDPLELRLQPIGESFDFDGTSIEGFSLKTDVSSRLVNQVAVIGDNLQIEDTFPLYPAWDPAYDHYLTDATLQEQLQLEHEAWLTNPELARVGRDFVLNEDGSYGGLRPGLPAFFNFNERAGLVAQFMASRRRFLPCLTIGPDLRPIGEHRGTVTEFFDYTRSLTSNAIVPGSGAWKSLSESGSADCTHVQLLQKECGIRFAGKNPPWELIELGVANILLRITATVEMDQRLNFTTDPVASPNVHRVVKVVDVPTRFKWRVRLATSKHAAAGLPATTVDDLAAAGAFAQELLANWNQASVNGAVPLPGTDWNLDRPLGRPLKGLTGRNLNFATTVPGQTPEKFPVIMGYTLDFEQHRTTLQLDTWRREL